MNGNLAAWKLVFSLLCIFSVCARTNSLYKHWLLVSDSVHVLKSHWSLINAPLPRINSWTVFPYFYLFYPLLLSACENVCTSYLFIFPLSHLSLPFWLTHGVCNLNTHTANRAMLWLPVPAIGEEVSCAIRGAYPAGDQRTHNPITHPGSSLDPHYHLPWRDLLGQMIGTPHLPTPIPHPLVSLGTLADTQGYDYKHLFTRLTYIGLYSSSLKTNYYIAIVHADQYEQLP